MQMVGASRSSQKRGGKLGGWFLREALAALPLLVALSLWERGAVGPSARQMEGGRGTHRAWVCRCGANDPGLRYQLSLRSVPEVPVLRDICTPFAELQIANLTKFEF